MKIKKIKKKGFAFWNPTKALSWIRQGFPLGFVLYVGVISLEIMLKGGD